MSPKQRQTYKNIELISGGRVTLNDRNKLTSDKMKSSTFYFYFTKILSTRIMKFRAHKTVW